MSLLVNDTALAAIVSFLVLAYLLSRLAWQPLRQLMADRQNRIALALKDAADSRDEAHALRRQLEEERQNARSDAQKLFARTEKAAREEAAEIVAAAKANAAQLEAVAAAQIKAERAEALRSLRGEVADLAMRIAERVVRADLDGERQRAVLEQALNDVVRLP